MRSIRRIWTIAIAGCLALSSIAQADVIPYSQDFEGLSKTDGAALANDGWLVGANVFDPNGGFIYNYFSFPAPNGGGGFSAIADGSAGPNQGVQYLNVYSDYNNGDHGNGNYIDALVFKEQTLGAGDVGAGKALAFGFDYLKNGAVVNGDGDTRTYAFIKVLKQSDLSYAQLGIIEFETTGASTSDWARAFLSLSATDLSWAGELVQFGFRSYATNYNDSGRFYDNLSFAAVPEPATASILAIGLAGLLVRRRR
jgi:hypothetical protein